MYVDCIVHTYQDRLGVLIVTLSTIRRLVGPIARPAGRPTCNHFYQCWRIREMYQCLKANKRLDGHRGYIPMIAPQCIFAYGSSPVKISHKTIPKENHPPACVKPNTHYVLAYHGSICKELSGVWSEKNCFLRDFAAVAIQYLWCHPWKSAADTTRNQSVALDPWQPKVSNLRISKELLV